MCPGAIGAKANPTRRARRMESEVWIVWWVNLAFICIRISQKLARSPLQNSARRMQRTARLILGAPGARVRAQRTHKPRLSIQAGASLFALLPLLTVRAEMIASGSERRSCVSSHMSEHLESERGRFNPNRCVLGGDRRQTVSSHHLAHAEVHSDLHMVQNGERRPHALVVAFNII